MSFEKGENMMEVMRRNFLKGGVAMGVTAAAAGVLAGCAPSKPQAEEEQSELDEVTKHLKERVVGADLPDAAPIPPVAVPESFDEEVDVIVVGTGGAGLAATVYLAQQGCSVVAIEKQNEVGGVTRHGATFVVRRAEPKTRKRRSSPCLPILWMRTLSRACIRWTTSTPSTSILSRI